MTDENKLTRRGFLGIVGAIGVAPLIVTRALPGEVPVVEIIDVPVRAPAQAMHGTILKYKTQHGQWIPLGEVTEVFGPIAPVEDGPWMNRVAGLVNAGEINITLVENKVVTDLQSPVLWVGDLLPIPFQLVYHDTGSGSRPSQWEFKAYVLGYLVETGGGEPPTSTLELRMVGKPQFYVGMAEGEGV